MSHFPPLSLYFPHFRLLSLFSLSIPIFPHYVPVYSPPILPHYRHFPSILPQCSKFPSLHTISPLLPPFYCVICPVFPDFSSFSPAIPKFPDSSLRPPHGGPAPPSPLPFPALAPSANQSPSAGAPRANRSEARENSSGPLVPNGRGASRCWPRPAAREGTQPRGRCGKKMGKNRGKWGKLGVLGRPKGECGS